MTEAVPMSERVRNLKVYGHVNKVSPSPKLMSYLLRWLSKKRRKKKVPLYFGRKCIKSVS